MSTPHLDRSEQWPDGSCNYGTIEDVEARHFQMLPGQWWRRRLFLEKAPRCAVSHQSSWEAMDRSNVKVVPARGGVSQRRRLGVADAHTYSCMWEEVRLVSW